MFVISKNNTEFPDVVCKMFVILNKFNKNLFIIVIKSENLHHIYQQNTKSQLLAQTSSKIFFGNFVNNFKHIFKNNLNIISSSNL